MGSSGACRNDTWLHETRVSFVHSPPPLNLMAPWSLIIVAMSFLDSACGSTIEMRTDFEGTSNDNHPTFCSHLGVLLHSCVEVGHVCLVVLLVVQLHDLACEQRGSMLVVVMMNGSES